MSTNTRTVVMYDDVNVDLIPADAQYIAAYADGTYANLEAVRKRFPKATVLTIDVRSSYRSGDVLDVETGDAHTIDAPWWFRAREGHTGTKPIIYTSAGNVAALHGTMRAAGIKGDRYYVWSAHYNGVEHICGTNGCTYPAADATQWTNKSHGRSLDQSLVNSYILPAPAPSSPSAGTKVEAAIKDLTKAHGGPQRMSVIHRAIAMLKRLRSPGTK